jgi:RNA polymerase sigma factor (sigma-70 family)
MRTQTTEAVDRLGLDSARQGARSAPGAEAIELRAVNDRSFEDVYRVDYPRMVRAARLITGSTATAEEIVQDAFIALYPRFDRLANPSGYLYRSVVNGSLAQQRHERVVERLRHLTAASEAMAPTDLDETWLELRKLPPRRRAAVVLRYYADLPVAEVAAVLGCQPGAVKSMLHRALAQLKGVIGR